MDLLIEKNRTPTKLSALGVSVRRIEDSSPILEADKRTVKGRSGVVYAGARYTSKQISIKARMYVPTIRAFELKKDELNGLLVDSEPFYITKMYPDNDELYGFELPGQSKRELDLLNVVHRKWHYRYLITIADKIEYSFLGKSNKGLLYDVAMAFETARLPFGETIPSDITVVNNQLIPYNGTADCSQLEHPWVLKLRSSGDQKVFFVEINNRRFTYQHSANLSAGDVIEIHGVETRLNRINVNGRTNYMHFILKGNSTNRITTDFKGTMQIVNFVELYK